MPQIHKLIKKAAKKIKSIKFPHISFRFPARFTGVLKIVSVFLILVVLFLNIISDHLPEDTERALAVQIFANPTLVDLHVELGKYYFFSGKQAWAETEFEVAQQLFEKKNKEEKPTKQSPSQLWQSLKTKKEKTLKEIDYWNKVNQALPDYVYAELKLAQLYFDLGENDKALSFALKVLESEPANKLARDIINHFSSL